MGTDKTNPDKSDMLTPPIFLPPPEGSGQHWVNMQARGAIKGTSRFGFQPGLQFIRKAPFCVFYLCYLKRDKQHKITETDIKCIAYDEVAEWIVANLKCGDIITIVRAEPFISCWRSSYSKGYVSEVQWNVRQIDVEDYEPKGNVTVLTEEMVDATDFQVAIRGLEDGTSKLYGRGLPDPDPTK
jgi:hypothetical protein